MVDQIDFYVLGKVDRIGKLKYACRLAQKAFKQGLKVYLQTPGQQDSVELDELLWTFSQGSFVPHALTSAAADNWQDFPVQLGDTAPQHPQADLLISLVDSAPENYHGFQRIAELVTDDPGEKSAARVRFRFYRDQGIEPVTHNLG